MNDKRVLYPKATIVDVVHGTLYTTSTNVKVRELVIDSDFICSLKAKIRQKHEEILHLVTA